LDLTEARRPTPVAPFFFAAPICPRRLSREKIECIGGNGKSQGAQVKQILRKLIGAGLLSASSISFAQTQSVPILRQEALTLEQQGKSKEAELKWRALLATHPKSPEPLAHIGLLEARQEHYKEAVPFYRKALAINPNVPGLRLNLALALFKCGQLKEAIPEFEILRRNATPNSPEAHRATILIGMAYYGLADYAKAAPYLKEAADDEPNNLQLLLALGHSYLWSNQSKNVLSVYRRILLLNPDSAEADMIAGEALDEMKDNAGALAMFRAAVKANPRQPNAHFGLGYLLWSQKQYPEAEQEFHAEIANDPGHIQSMLYLADAYIQMNRIGEAAPLLETILKTEPDLALAHLDLGIVASESGHNDEALHELTRAEKLMPDDVNVHWRLARLYRTMGRKDEAKAEFDKASSLNRQVDQTLYEKIANGRKHPPQGQTPPAPPEE
jgi:tetratricopeptide (TPR) repeat protein